MYRIGEFSKKVNLSVDTLRYYNDIGLLIPEEVDIYSNYRYYGERNLNEVKIINNLKRVGFSLEEIKNNWNNFTDEIYKKKQEELKKEMKDMEDKLKILEDMRKEIKKKEIKVKSIGGYYE